MTTAGVVMSDQPMSEYFTGSVKAVRRHFGVTQVDLAQAMGTSQSAISRIERQPDVHLSTLVKYVEGIGGRLRLVVEHPDGNAVIRPACPGCGSTIARVHKWPPRQACRVKNGGSAS